MDLTGDADMEEADAASGHIGTDHDTDPFRIAPGDQVCEPLTPWILAQRAANGLRHDGLANVIEVGAQLDPSKPDDALALVNNFYHLSENGRCVTALRYFVVIIRPNSNPDDMRGLDAGGPRRFLFGQTLDTIIAFLMDQDRQTAFFKCPGPNVYNSADMYKAIGVFLGYLLTTKLVPIGFGVRFPEKAFESIIFGPASVQGLDDIAAFEAVNPQAAQLFRFVTNATVFRVHFEDASHSDADPDTVDDLIAAVEPLQWSAAQTVDAASGTTSGRRVG